MRVFLFWIPPGRLKFRKWYRTFLVFHIPPYRSFSFFLSSCFSLKSWLKRKSRNATSSTPFPAKPANWPAPNYAAKSSKIPRTSCTSAKVPFCCAWAGFRKFWGTPRPFPQLKILTSGSKCKWSLLVWNFLQTHTLSPVILIVLMKIWMPSRLKWDQVVQFPLNSLKPNQPKSRKSMNSRVLASKWPMFWVKRSTRHSCKLCFAFLVIDIL